MKVKFNKLIIIALVLVLSLISVVPLSKSNIAEAAGACVVSDVPVYQFWSDRYTDHYYTASWTQRQHLINDYPNNVWRYQKIAFYVPSGLGEPLSGEPGGSPVDPPILINQYLSKTRTDHVYSVQWTQKTGLIGTGKYQYQGSPFYVYENSVSEVWLPGEGGLVTREGVAVYQFWSPYFQDHYYTANWVEKQNLIKGSFWQYQGRAFDALHSTSACNNPPN